MPAQQCTRHPDRETLRICGRCERPFCPDCLVPTPVGGRCKDCARGPSIPRLKIQPWRWPLIALAALFMALVASLVVARIGFFGLILSFLAGQLIGSAMLAVSGRKPGRALAIVTVVFILVGGYLSTPVALVATALSAAEGSVDAGQTFAAGLRIGLLDFWTWIMAALMAYAAYTRIR